MPRKGLTKKAVIDAAIELIEEHGNHAFSLNELARKLEIKPASLYNHIENLEELTCKIRIRIAEMLRQAELKAIEGKTGDCALFALCDAYHCFAYEHIELYKLNMGKQIDKSAFINESCEGIVDPMMKVISDFQLDECQKMHWHRILRAMLHGFITQEYAGGFRHFPIKNNETYHMAIETILLGIHTAEKETLK